MDTFYPVSFNGEAIGKISVCRQGLYYLFSCRCPLFSDNIYRLIVCCENQEENLGILVPKDGSYILNTKVPVKRLGEGAWQFYLKAKQENLAGFFVPISPEEPFSYISRLKESFLEQRNGQIGIRVNQT